MNDPFRFLVVDPLAGVQTFARQLLLSQGFAADSILCCNDSDAALAQGLLFRPHILVTDWLPKAPLTGIQLYQRLREASPSLRLALLSFDITPAHEAEARALGAEFLLKKPFSAEQLKAQMLRVLETLPKGAPAAQRPARETLPPARPLPPLAPQLIVKPGDTVRYNGQRHVAQYVVHRPGETVVQLKGVAGLIALHRLQPG